ncbi:MAG: aminotransferase class I/II-fold pyridoxal phosphate-dependent enzyme [Candidatus Diapherotrites archaeon]|nr:aminotransferase class I/II-fold pyridoxal phosphate-dependent enzyme [Candidatus Diapherotrites archaeon]
MMEASKKSELISYPIRDIVQEAKVLQKQGKDMIYLNIGDPGPYGFRPPQHILDAAEKALHANYSGYAPSDGDPELKQVIADYEKVQSDDVFVCSGLSEGIDFLFQAMVDPGRNIILPSPTYPLYLTKQRMSFGSEVFYESDENWEPDVEDMRKKINKYTKAILVVSPNNPTGAVYSKKTLQDIVNLAGEFKLPIISDDAYELLVFDGSSSNLRDLCKEVPIVNGNSLSKNYIYPGARVGYIAFRGEGWDKIKDAVQRLCNQRLSVNWEMQRAYIAAIQGNTDHVTQFNSELKKRCDVLDQRIKAIPGLKMVKPKGAFYAFVEVEAPFKNKWKSDWAFVRALLHEGVVVVPGTGFTSTLHDRMFFRIVFLPPVEKLNQALDRIENFMKKN